MVKTLGYEIEKCKTVHFGRKNLRRDSSGSEITLGSSKFERDLGVMVSEDLKWERHISTIEGYKLGYIK